MNPDITIVGGGASGVMAAIEAKRNNKELEILILERKDRVLKKVLVTGNGRCNITNVGANISNYFSTGKNSREIENKNREEVKKILENFTPTDTINFFENIGIVSNLENRGKIYPLSGQASSVVDALRFEAERLGVKFLTEFYVTDIKKNGLKFEIYSEDKKLIKSNRVLIAAGGKSYPELGANGSGFEIAKKLGHKITSLSPAIVQLKTEKYQVKGLQGVKIDTNITAYGEDNTGKRKKICTYDGELLFTEYGISGNVVFNISFVMPIYKNVEFEIDFMPRFEYNELFDMLKKRREILGHLTMENYFNGMINKKLGQFLAKMSGIEKLSKEIYTLDDNEIKKLCQLLKKYKVNILETTGFKNAQVTAGGVSLDDVNIETLESKKVKGLYFSGEVLDVYGECGGYNLQWAWASGHRVGKVISQ